MKKTILAIAIPVLFASAANAAVVYEKDGTKLDVFGRVQTNFYGDADNSPSMQQRSAGIDGSARLGLDASVMLSDSWNAFAFSELQLSENDAVNADSAYVRHLYAGFEGKDFGRILFGQTDTPFYDITEFTDIFNEYGTAGHYDRGRAAGQIIYSAKFMDNFLNMKAGVQFDEGDSKMAGSISTIMNFDESFKMGVAVDYVDHDIDTAIQFGLSAAYTMDDFYMAALVTMGDAVVDNYMTGGSKVGAVTGYEIVGAYTMDAWRFLGGYGQVMHDQDDFGYEDADDKKQATMGAEYSFTKNLIGYAEYAIKPNDDIYTVAVQYNF